MEEHTYIQSGKTITSAWQKEVYKLVTAEGAFGMTDGEVQNATGTGHGSTSSALSSLHRAGYLARLKEKRGKFTVYVHPKFIKKRETLPPMTNKGLVAVGHSNQNDSDLAKQNKKMKKMLDEVYDLVRPKWRSYSYDRNALIDDIRKAIKR